MVQRVNNFQEIQTVLDTVLGFDDVKIAFDISISNHQEDISSRYGSAYMHVGGPSVELYLKYYINQMSVDSPSIIFTKIEHKLTELLYHVDGVFSQRVVEPFRANEVTTIYYTVKLQDFENFVSKLDTFARLKYDREFTEALEAKLSES